MSYATTNPPVVLVPGVGGSPTLWLYKSADAVATVAGAGYFTDAANLGMKENDVVLVVDTGNHYCHVTVVSATVTTVVTDPTIN